MEKLTNANIIRSVSDDQHQILKWIIKLYVPEGRFDYDPTYSKGNFYKDGVLDPVYRSDLTGPDFKADVRNTPIKSNSLASIIFDPPFVMGSGPSVAKPKPGGNIISKRFGIFKNHRELWMFYAQAIVEFWRLLRKKGVLVFKCQDCIHHNNQHLSHVAINNYATRMGFYAKDLFVLIKHSTILSGKVKNQEHARKYHSYFLVFIKEKPKVLYP